MQFITDEFNIDIIMKQTGSDHADIAMVQGGHLIAEMAQIAHSMAIGIKKFCMSCCGVNCRRGNSVSKQFRSKYRSSFNFRCVRNLFYREYRIESFYFINIGKTDKSRVLSTDKFAVDEWSFQMNSRKFATVGVLPK